MSEASASSARPCLWARQSTRDVGRRLHKKLIAPNLAGKRQPLGQHSIRFCGPGGETTGRQV